MEDNQQTEITPYLFPTSDPSKVVLVLDGGSSQFNDIFINFIVILIEGFLFNFFNKNKNFINHLNK